MHFVKRLKLNCFPVSLTRLVRQTLTTLLGIDEVPEIIKSPELPLREVIQREEHKFKLRHLQARLRGEVTTLEPGEDTVRKKWFSIIQSLRLGYITPA